MTTTQARVIVRCTGPLADLMGANPALLKFDMGTTVRGLIETHAELASLCHAVLDKGGLVPFVSLFLNGEDVSVNSHGMEAPLASGDALDFFLSVPGG